MTTQGENELNLTEEMISARAYQRYAARGREDGHDLEDWLAAEVELRTSQANPPVDTKASNSQVAERTPRVRTVGELGGARG